MRKLLRYRRIAFSALCGVACVLLIALWVRSYSCSEELFWKKANWNGVGVWSGAGRIVLSIHPVEITAVQRQTTTQETLATVHGLSYLGPWTDVDWEHVLEEADRNLPTIWGFGAGRGIVNRLIHVSAPHWFFILLLAASAALPWRPWPKRFSLRTLLIATTLIAITLGVIVSTK